MAVIYAIQSHEAPGQFTGPVRAKIKETRAGPHDFLKKFGPVPYGRRIANG